MESKFATVNGIKLHYVSAGSGKLILFVHGFPEFWGAWRAQLAEFSKDYQAVALDMRGYNLSDKPAEVKDYRPKQLVADLIGLIKALGHERAIVVAHDWGGAVAWNLAAQHPEVVEKLVIINAPHPVCFMRELAHDKAQQQASEYINMFRTPDAERILSENDYAHLLQLIKGWKAGDSTLDANEEAMYKAAWSQPGALTGGLNYYRASPIHPPGVAGEGARAMTLDPEPFKVKVPTLVIWGDRDHALLMSVLDGLDEFVADLRIEHIPEATHWVVHEYPDRVNELIRSFI
jgi:epoxide hydrolase 4